MKTFKKFLIESSVDAEIELLSVYFDKLSDVKSLKDTYYVKESIKKYPKLSLSEIIAIRLYTGTGYKVFNDKTTPDKVRDILSIAIKKLPKYSGIVTRETYLPDMALQNYLDSNVIIEKDRFTSGTIKEGFKYGSGQEFIIHSKSGRVIGDLSYNPYEQEIIFDVNSKFKKISQEQLSSTHYRFVLEQI